MPSIPFALQWSIDENRLLTLKDSVDDEFLLSDLVSNIPEFNYYLKIQPNGEAEDRGQTWMFLQIDFKNVKKVEVDFTIKVESTNYSKTDHCVYEKSIGWGYKICDTKDFFDTEKNFIVDGKFTAKVNGIFKFEYGIAVIAEHQKWQGGDLGDESWKKDDTKDFTIIVDGDKEIKVHKFILSVRSKVFEAMLNSNMKEVKENKVEIPDFAFNIVETGIKIIYDCNFISLLSLDELMSLLHFFDKYNLSTPKAKVEPYLINQISGATVVRLTNSSVLTNSPKLKEKCMKYLTTAFKQQTPLTDFKILDKEVVFEILENSFHKTVGTK